MVVEPLADELGPFVEGLAAARRGELWGFVDREGTWVVPPTYARVLEFVDSVAAVRDGDRWQLIDRAGKVVSGQASRQRYRPRPDLGPVFRP